MDLRIGNGIAYVETGACRADGPFDVAIIDMTDNPLQSFFSTEFYHELAACVRPEGVVTQNVNSLDDLPALKRAETSVPPLEVVSLDLAFGQQKTNGFFNQTSSLACRRLLTCSGDQNLTKMC